jgi:tetratricopeptide (TPR) repeat protein
MTDMTDSPSRPPLADSYEGLHRRAQQRYMTGDLEGTLTLYRRLTDKLARLSDAVLARRPDLRDLHRTARLELTSLLSQQGRYAEARAAEEVLLESHPEESDRWRRDLARLRVAKGEVEAGLADLRDLAEAQSHDAEPWLLLGIELRIEGRLAESLAALDRALVVAQEHDIQKLASIYYQRFGLLKRMGRLDDALAAWEQALQHDPAVAESIQEVYEALTEAGRYSEARSYLEREENPLLAGYQRGILASRIGQVAEARQAWQAVADLDPDDYEYGYDAWVESVLRLGDPEPALEWLQDALARHGTTRLLILSGIGWAMRQDQELASRLFQGAINSLSRQRPPKKKLDGDDWRLLDSLVWG